MGLSDLVTVIGSADFTSDAKRLELLDLLGGLTPLDVEGEQTLLQGLVEEGDTIILVCPIERAAITYILVNWREMMLSVAVKEDLEEIVNKFVADNSVQIANDLINAINNADMVQNVIQNLSRLDQ